MTKKRIPGPLVLLILDGWGYRAEKKDNGIELANKPFFDSLWRDYPRTLIDGSGPAVGLPAGIMGNSEVGHMNLGAGRVVYSGLSQIYNAIENGGFFTNPALLKAVTRAKEKKSTLHLMGLVSDGAVHSHQDHLYALLELAKRHDVGDVAVHVFLDGRDTPPKDGIKYVSALLERMQKIGVGRVASVAGRYFAMDRDKRWDRVEKAYHAICGTSPNQTQDVLAYLRDSYVRDIGDEFIEPTCVLTNGSCATMQADDAVIFFNFRADRARQISHAFTDVNFAGFGRGVQALPGVFVCMAPYESTIAAPVAFVPSYPERILPEILSENGLKQLRIAETEKYAHVTFFFNGGREVIFDGEDRVLVPSPKDVATYDQKPEMSALQVKDELLGRLKSGGYDVVICNFANTDMVGHTAVPAAIFKAVATVDHCLAEIVPAVLAMKGVVLVTADHGNAEQMRDEKGEPLTAHTTNLVPFMLIGHDAQAVLRPKGGRLCDVAPTMLALLGLDQPSEMTGVSLLL